MDNTIDHPAAAEYRVALDALHAAVRALAKWHDAAYVVRRLGGDDRFTDAGHRDALNILDTLCEVEAELQTHATRHHAAGATAARASAAPSHEATEADRSTLVAINAVQEVIANAAKRRESFNARIAELESQYYGEDSEVRGTPHEYAEIRFLQGWATRSAGLEDEITEAITAALSDTRG